MRFDPARVRHGEWIAAAGAIALLICMFVLPWYGLTGRFEHLVKALGVATSVDAWNSFTVVRWLLLATVAATLILLWLQGSRPAPALPASFSVIATVLGFVSALVLIYRVLLSSPFSSPLVSTKVGAYLGLVSSLVLVYGAFRSLREEERAAPPPDSIRTVDLSGPG